MNYAIDHVEAVLGLVVLVIGVLTSIAGGLAWYRSKIAQDVERKRDFNHLKNNYKQLSANVDDLWTQNEARYDHLFRQIDRIEIKLDPDKTIPHFKAPQRNP
ncbi:MAG: hypothetical protein ACFB0C_00395 [Leptolyngbyaceae cyanobacterium]